MGLRVLLLCVLAACVTADRTLQALNQQHLLGAKANTRQAFHKWMAQHKKGYANDLKEFEARYRNWLNNLDFVMEYNSKQKSHWLGMNALADLSHDEYKQKYTLGFKRFNHKPSNKLQTFRHGALDADTLPTAVDWRQQKAVAEVKNQAQCGSCWAFATTGAVEGVNAIVTGELTSLSEQMLVDCDTDKDSGCNGGLMDYAFEFIHKNGGITTEEEYPYTGEDGTCEEDKMNHHVVTIDGYEDVPQMDEVALKKAASQQPIAVAIEADQRAFQLYVGGVFDDEDCGEELDHGVLVVGYGVETSEEADAAQGDAGSDDKRKPRNYWIVKNSWGAGWGDQGYIKIRMGRGKAGMCGIAMQPSYPTKKSPNPPPTPGPGPKPGPKPGPGPSPKPPTPEPVECDDYNECPPGTTCCCLRNLAGFCFTWGCCPMENATCCPDKEHCCPENLPVCDVDEGRCLPKQGSGITSSAPWATKVPATRKAPAGWWSSRRNEQTQSIKVAAT